MMEKVKKILYIVLIIIMLPILFVSGVILANSYIHPDKVPSFFGWKPFIVLSGSMETKIYAGDIAIIKETDNNNLKENDIIAFKKGETVITHRIVKIENKDGKKIFYTKGDNNNTIDNETVSIDEIEGVYVSKISGLGNVAMYLQTPTGMISCLSIPIALMIVMQIMTSINENRKIKEVKNKWQKRIQIFQKQWDFY